MQHITGTVQTVSPAMAVRRNKGTLAFLLICLALVSAACATSAKKPAGPSPSKFTPCPGFEYGPTEGFPLDFGKGDLAQAVSTYVAAIKGADSGDYRPPTPEERTAFATAWDTFDNQEKRQRLNDLGYDLFLYDDTGDPHSGARYDVACERRNSEGTWDRGWGLYMANHRGFNVVTEVPHPKFDTNSADVGVAIARVRGGSLYIAGAHRQANGEFTPSQCMSDPKCSDMSHQPASVFQAVHDITINPPECQPQPQLCHAAFAVIQPHGFDSSKHQGIGNVAISSGEPEEFESGTLIADIASDLEKDGGFAICRFESPGDCAGKTSSGKPGTSLGATLNVQGKSARNSALIVAFVHLEIADTVRDKVDGEQSRRQLGRIVGLRLGDVGSG